jgi:ElaB/YqjD/DUF883 family membrane-anchored ribosome-binding protein
MVDSDRIVGAAKSGVQTQAEGVVQNAAGQVKDAAREVAENITDASAAAYDRGTKLVMKSPGNALLMAGAIGFALGVLLTKGSQPRRNTLQRYYDRYGG